MTSTTHYGSVSGGSTFIVLPKGIKPGRGLNAALRSIYDRFANNQSWMGKNSYSDIELQPLSNVHFNSKYAGGGEWVQAINTNWLWFFGSVGLAVLILACINFINLSTAQALTRAKEIGVRKTIGARRFQLIRQFLSEALLLVLFSGILGLLITKLSLPYINDLTGKQIIFDIANSPSLLGLLLAGILLTALMAGIYPAWIITKFRPATTLKSGSINVNPQSALLRKGLVVAQFGVSVCLLICLLLIGKQMNYMRHKNLGFNKDNLVMIPLPPGNSMANKELLVAELGNTPGIKGWSFSTSPPSGGENIHWGTLMSLIGPEDPNRKQVTTIMTDDKFCSLYDLQLKAGRFFTKADTNAVSETLPEKQRFPKSVVNEKLVRELGFKSPRQHWANVSG